MTPPATTRATAHRPVPTTPEPAPPLDLAARHLTAATPGLAGVLNDRATLRTLLAGPRTVPEIRAITGVSKPTAYQSVARLQGQSLAEPAPVPPRGARRCAGPAAERFQVPAGTAPLAAVTVSAHRIEVALVDVTGRGLGPGTVSTRPGAAGPPGRAEVVGGVTEACRRAGLTPHRLAAVVVGATLAAARHLLDERPGPDEENLPSGLQVHLDADLAATAEQHLGPADLDAHLLVWGGEELLLSGRVQGLPVSGYSGTGLAHRTSRLFRELDLQALDRPARTGPRTDADDAAAELLAAGLARSLVGPVCLLDPHTVVLAGPRLTARAPGLAPLLHRELARLVPAAPAVRGTAVHGDPVLSGALSHGLAEVREQLMNSIGHGTAPGAPPSA
ncbi:hypothetical protein ACFV6F_19795 [Kitasatospora phosalacinea]|uniref:hypothetical protein n=1 Tax=Kitasatospora phosalacinea TaxID=2065 RepID=UPI00364E9E1C